MSTRTHIKLKQLLIITAAWVIVGFLISLYDHLVLFTDSSRGPVQGYSFLIATAFNVGSGIFGAMLGGSLLVFYVNVKYQDKPYGYTILTVCSSFLLIIVLITFIRAALTLPAQTGKPLFHADAMDALRTFLLNSTRAKNTLVWLVVVCITQLLLQFYGKFGQGVFVNTMRGKYNTPRHENKVFMFLDINSSTSIAEKLGDEKYHALLKDFFADITNPILENKGEIYQYVGDEVVIAWDYAEGIRNNQCIRCFFDIKQYIADNRDKYIRRYGLVPDFKGGIHSGNVVAGEIGTVKREITYSGDVLNTTSRILSMCRQFGAEMLASANLAAELCLDNTYITHPLGAIKLKGKEKEIMLSAISSIR